MDEERFSKLCNDKIDNFRLTVRRKHMKLGSRGEAIIFGHL